MASASARYAFRRGACVSASALVAACSPACADPEEFHTQVFLRAFDTDGEALARAHVRFRDAAGEPVGEGDLQHGNGFRFESESLGDDGDWGRRARAADIEAGTCSSRDDRIEFREESSRVASGGHPSLRSRKVTVYELRATLVCVRPLDDEHRALYERSLREGEAPARMRAAVELGWLRPPEDASDELKAAMQDGAAIALGLVHHPSRAALPALIAALRDDREQVRFAAALLLAKLGRNEHGVAVAALPALEARSGDPSEPVRFVAAHAVGRIAPR